MQIKTTVRHHTHTHIHTGTHGIRTQTPHTHIHHTTQTPHHTYTHPTHIHSSEHSESPYTHTHTYHTPYHTLGSKHLYPPSHLVSPGTRILASIQSIRIFPLTSSQGDRFVSAMLSPYSLSTSLLSRPPNSLQV